MNVAIAIEIALFAVLHLAALIYLLGELRTTVKEHTDKLEDHELRLRTVEGRTVELKVHCDSVDCHGTLQMKGRLS